MNARRANPRQSWHVTLSLGLIGGLFLFAGAMHFLKPGMYVRIVPPWLPAPMALVLISGVAEMLGGAGVLIPATRVVAGWGLLALLVAVFPANIQMMTDGVRGHGSLFWKFALVARLPLQPLMMWWIYKAAIRGE